MKRHNALLVAAVALGTMISTRAAVPDPGKPVPMTLELALTRSVITVGEPVGLAYAWKNTGDNPVDVYEGDGREEWPRLQILDSRGKAIKKVWGGFPGAYPRTAEESGNGSQIARFRVQPGAAFEEGKRLLTHEFPLIKPGTYTVEASIVLSARIAPSDTSTEFFEGADFITSSRSVKLVVKPPNPARLRWVAGNLLDRVQDKKLSVRDRRYAMLALLTMPADSASWAWRRLVDSHRLEQDGQAEFVNQLWQLRHPAGTDLLLAVWDSPNQPEEVKGAARGFLQDRFWDSDDRSERQRIDEAFVRHTGHPPVSVAPFIRDYGLARSHWNEAQNEEIREQEAWTARERDE